MSGHDERNNIMSKMIETLKNNGWVETTLMECRVGDEALLIQAGLIPWVLTVARVNREEGIVRTSDGTTRAGVVKVLRAPRPEPVPGTVALITWDEVDESVRDLLPVRAMMDAEGVWRGAEVVPPRSLDRIEVIRVLLPADQDTPTVEVTDEMVERAAEAYYTARYKEPTTGSQWDAVCEDSPIDAARYRQEARAALEAALGVEK